ncbi:VOC family protein [Nocardia veterana]|uniref:VOC family protein n=1 Tax=Nocardia veterana TaxID=132249 RepID=A0A7X6LWL2_9NOCA|nr:VOC family protein [Nocardia veterana]NKY85948.1 VOC family protein [Nocardia veterana]
MKSATAYLLFNGEAEEAFTFYRSVLGGELQMVRYRDMGGEGGSSLPEEVGNRIANAALTWREDQLLMGSDAPPDQRVGHDNVPFAVCLDVDDQAEAERIFTGLSEGGQVTMPLGKTEWAAQFGMVTDKFSVPWMVNLYGGE